jgi:hypothetical protein
LQISGVGDPEHLGRIGVPVIHELRGVGKNGTTGLRTTTVSSRRPLNCRE